MQQTSPEANNGAVAGDAANTATVNSAVIDGQFKLEKGQRIKVSTDLFQAEIDTFGGDLRHLVLNKHRAADVKNGNFVLMDEAQKPMLYIAQTGLMGNDLPNHKSQFTSAATSYTMAEGAASQEVRLILGG